MGASVLEGRYRRRRFATTMLASALVTGSAAAAWYFLVRAPQPEALCEHVLGLSASRAELQAWLRPRKPTPDAPTDLDDLEALCLWNFRARKASATWWQWGSLGRCVLRHDRVTAYWTYCGAW